jgi:hypothetical protein
MPDNQSGNDRYDGDKGNEGADRSNGGRFCLCPR